MINLSCLNQKIKSYAFKPKQAATPSTRVDIVSGFTYPEIQSAYYTEPVYMIDIKNALKALNHLSQQQLINCLQAMVIKKFKIYLMIAGLLILPSLMCTKKKIACPKEGYIYSNSTFRCWYSPETDSVPLGSSITLEASLPKTFIDENTKATVSNTSNIVSGSLGVGMIYPIYQAAVDSFELIAQIGKVIKDTLQFSEGMLKGFRSVQWDASPIDSFKIKISIKALAKGTYGVALKQQTAKDKDCALYKYFLSPGNANQHLNYWMDAFGNVSDEVAFFTYCFKVY